MLWFFFFLMGAPNLILQVIFRQTQFVFCTWHAFFQPKIVENIFKLFPHQILSHRQREITRSYHPSE